MKLVYRAMNILERLRRKPFAVIGHRGAAGLAPENTVRAIEEGIRARADIVEVDIRLTSDGKPVVFHDPDLSRLAGIDKRISETTYRWLRENIRIGGEPIPLLDEILETARGKAGLFIEIKEPEATRVVLETVEKYGMIRDVAIISFLDEALIKAREIMPGAATGLIYYRPPGRIIDAKRIGAKIVLPHHRLATPRANAFAHRLGLLVVAWTINDENEMIKAYRSGVDGIATDRPDIAARLREKLSTGNSTA